jgi:ECF transporter S component (folate family)
MLKLTSKMSLQRLVFLSFLLALQIVLSNLAIGNSFFKISLVFIPNALIGMIAGPLWTALILAFGDLISSLLSGYAYFPGFTISAFIVGILYGFFFYRKFFDIKNRIHWLYLFGAMTVIMLVDSTFFNTIWVTMIIPHASFATFLSLLAARALLLVQIPFQTIILMLLIPTLQSIKTLKIFL